jgi:hypothetical protein
MHKRLYSLYQVQRGKWIKVSDVNLTKERAVRVFQNALLGCTISGFPEVQLRPIREEFVEPVGKLWKNVDGNLVGA